MMGWLHFWQSSCGLLFTLPDPQSIFLVLAVGKKKTKWKISQNLENGFENTTHLLIEPLQIEAFKDYLLTVYDISGNKRSQPLKMGKKSQMKWDFFKPGTRRSVLCIILLTFNVNQPKTSNLLTEKSVFKKSRINKEIPLIISKALTQEHHLCSVKCFRPLLFVTF